MIKASHDVFIYNSLSFSFCIVCFPGKLKKTEMVINHDSRAGLIAGAGNTYMKGEIMAEKRNTLKPHEKIAMSISEAAEYSHLGENLIRKIIENDKSIDWVLFVGDWIRIKRKPFERWLLAQSNI